MFGAFMGFGGGGPGLGTLRHLRKLVDLVVRATGWRITKWYKPLAGGKFLRFHLHSSGFVHIAHCLGNKTTLMHIFDYCGLSISFAFTPVPQSTV